jgi:hypothetical protein
MTIIMVSVASRKTCPMRNRRTASVALPMSFSYAHRTSHVAMAIVAKKLWGTIPRP